jgi:hypothetical protein
LGTRTLADRPSSIKAIIHHCLVEFTVELNADPKKGFCWYWRSVRMKKHGPFESLSEAAEDARIRLAN